MSIITISRGTASGGQALAERVSEKLGWPCLSNEVIVEDLMAGEEISLFCITDGTTLLPLPPAQDHKRVFDGDEGPNTGGMGAYSPAPVASDATLRRIEREVLVPVVHEMHAAGTPFTGLLFAGLMLAGYAMVRKMVNIKI